MFWKFNSPSSIQIDALLEKEDVTLFELMEEEELLQECRGQNKKLIEFLTKPDVLEELMSLIVCDPPPDKELEVRFKHANLASELITCDVPAIVDSVASSTNLLHTLYKFLVKEKPLNPLLASFVSKVFAMLFKRRSEQVFNYLKSKEDFVTVVVRHIGTSAIMDLLCKLISGVEDDESEIKRDIHQWMNDGHLVEQLLEKLSPHCESEEHSSVDQVLKEIIQPFQEPSSIKSSESQNNSCYSPLLVTLESREMINKLMDILLDEERNESSVSHVINVLLNLLSNRKINDQHTDCPNASTRNRSTVLSTILGRLHELQHILLQPTKLGTLKTAFGTEIERLGGTRLQVVSLIAALLATNDIQVHSEIAGLKTFQILLDLFFKFSLNNFLHTEVTRCITCIIRNPIFNDQPINNESKKASDEFNFETTLVKQEDEQIDGLNNNPNEMQNGEFKEECLDADMDKDAVKENKQITDDPAWIDPPDHPLLDQLFLECNLIQTILKCYAMEEETESAVTESKSHNLVGYMGHIREMANAIVNSTSEGDNSLHLKRLIELLPSEVKNDWDDFAQVTLAAENLKNKIIPQPFKGNSLGQSDDDSDDDFTSAEEFFSMQSMVVTNQGFKDGDVHTIADLGFHVDDLKNVEDLSGSFQRLSSQINAGGIGGQGSPGFEEDEGKGNMDLFKQLCMEKTMEMNEFDEMWKDKEKIITFGSSDKPSDSTEVEEHSSSEEEENEDEDDFDTLRNSDFDTSKNNDEKMEVDFTPDDWSDVFDKKPSGNIEDVCADSGFNPWQSAPASDTADNNSWADFGSFENGSNPEFGASAFESNPFGSASSSNNPFIHPVSEENSAQPVFPLYSHSTSTPNQQPTFEACTGNSQPTFESNFPDGLTAGVEPSSSNPVVQKEFSSFQAHFEGSFESTKQSDLNTSLDDKESESLRDICDVNNQTVDNIQKNSLVDIKEVDQSSENMDSTESGDLSLDQQDSKMESIDSLNVTSTSNQQDPEMDSPEVTASIEQQNRKMDSNESVDVTSTSNQQDSNMDSSESKDLTHRIEQDSKMDANESTKLTQSIDQDCKMDSIESTKLIQSIEQDSKMDANESTDLTPSIDQHDPKTGSIDSVDITSKNDQQVSKMDSTESIGQTSNLEQVSKIESEEITLISEQNKCIPKNSSEKVVNIEESSEKSASRCESYCNNQSETDLSPNMENGCIYLDENTLSKDSSVSEVSQVDKECCSDT